MNRVGAWAASALLRGVVGKKVQLDGSCTYSVVNNALEGERRCSLAAMFALDYWAMAGALTVLAHVV